MRLMSGQIRVCEWGMLLRAHPGLLRSSSSVGCPDWGTLGLGLRVHLSEKPHFAGIGGPACQEYVAFHSPIWLLASSWCGALQTGWQGESRFLKTGSGRYSRSKDVRA